jgi:hypothetical protein
MFPSVVNFRQSDTQTGASTPDRIPAANDNPMQTKEFSALDRSWIDKTQENVKKYALSTRSPH